MRPLLAAILLICFISSSVLAITPSVRYVSASTSQTFVQNCGQWPDSILFQAKVGAVSVWFSRQAVYYQFFQRDTTGTSCPPLTKLVCEAFEGANPNAEVVGEEEASYYCNYFIGQDSTNWHTLVPSFSSIRYKDLYPGIDVRFYFRNGHLEYDYLLSPEANPLAIRRRFEGIDSLSVGSSGELLATTGWSTIRQKLPTVSDASGRLLACSYEVNDSTYGLSLPEHTGELAMVIDPVLTFSSYLGGSGNEYAWDIDVDQNGYIYIVGYTTSADFPSSGVPTARQGWDIFVTKLSPLAHSIEWSTIVGGSADEDANAVKVAPDGSIVVGGSTASVDFPTYRALQPVLAVGLITMDALLFRLTPSGANFEFSTFLGNDGKDTLTDIDIDAAGNIYACGVTYSKYFPLKNPFKRLSGGDMVFACKVPLGGDSLIYSTFLGGAFMRVGIAIDHAGRAVVAGRTTDDRFPLKNAIDTTLGQSGGFVSKLVPTGNDVVFSTFISGEDNGWFSEVALDDQDNIYLTGSSSASFPLVNPLAQNVDMKDGVVTLLDSTGQSILFSTFWGGWDQGTDNFRAIGVDSSGYITVVGCNDGGFRFVNALDTVRDWYEAEVTLVKFRPNGAGVVYSTYLGGSGSDGAWALKVDNRGNAYIVGTNGLDDWPLVRPLDSTYAGDHGLPSECIVAIVSDNLTDVADDEPSGLPRAFALSQNYPNPFNGQTVIEFDLPRASDIELSIYNVLGEKVRAVAAGRYTAGAHRTIWDGLNERGESVASGIYFYRLEAGEEVMTRKLMLLK